MADPETPGTRDSTAYTCWSTPTFMSHHGMCLSAAVTYADALALAEGALYGTAAYRPLVRMHFVALDTDPPVC